MLSSLKASQLKTVAFLTGCASMPTKREMQLLLESHLQAPRLPSRNTRILSIDMGIRNLAYCVIDVPNQSTAEIAGDRQQSLIRGENRLHITAWKKLDLLDQSTLEEDGDGKRTTDPFLTLQDDSSASSNVLPTQMKNMFTPSSLSRISYRVAYQLLTHKPTTILIERQRFRSGGGSAIQEWTVRVNMMESMLWACFETLKHTRQSRQPAFPTVYEVNPARVAKFWTDGRHVPLCADEHVFTTTTGVVTDFETPGRGKIAKSEKISIVQDWLTSKGDWKVVPEFSNGTSEVAKSFLPKKSLKGQRSAAAAEPHGKLDDLADCLLQGAAWVRWEENRRRLVEMSSQYGRDT